MSFDIVNAVKQAGVVGAGGAGFPTHIKLKAKVDTYIANGAECEPLLRVDQQLMKTVPEKVVKGLQLGMEATGAEKGIIALKRKYSTAIKALEREISKDRRIELYLLDDFYPAGDEFVLVYETLKRLVPERGLPLDVGVVVNNVGTLINVAEANNGKPVITQPVTVTGAVSNPQTITVPIGTSIKDLIELAGGATVKSWKVIVGGPMMGNVNPISFPITKTTSGIIILPENHYLIGIKEQRISRKVVITKAACIRCQLCTEVCPRYLLGHSLYPDKIMRAIAFGGKVNPNFLTGAFLCVECGACTFYGCPMGLDPCKMMLEVRNQLILEGLKNPHSQKDLSVHQERNYRKLPLKRLVSRLNLSDYEHEAPWISKVIDPKIVRIKLKQHIGSPAIPIVSIGETVKKGDLIGKIPEGSLGAMVHASISGTVEQIKDEIVIKAINS